MQKKWVIRGIYLITTRGNQPHYGGNGRQEEEQRLSTFPYHGEPPTERPGVMRSTTVVWANGAVGWSQRIGGWIEGHRRIGWEGGSGQEENLERKCLRGKRGRGRMSCPGLPPLQRRHHIQMTT